MREYLPLKEHVQHTWNDLLTDTVILDMRYFPVVSPKKYKTSIIPNCIIIVTFKLKCEKIPYQYLNYSIHVSDVFLYAYLLSLSQESVIFTVKGIYLRPG